MKTRLLYLIIVFTLILTSACTTGTAAAQASAVAPDNQAADIQIADEQTQPPNPEQPEGQGQAPGGGTPPDAAYAACSAQSEGDACEFTSQKGVETGLCEMVQDQLACSPQRGPAGADQNNGSGPVNPDQGEANGSTTPGQGNGGGAAYNIEQALSDRAQGMTISFDALGFLTGSLGADSFYPPGKVADFWGFQYLRDNDPSQMGHNTDFLTRAAFNMLYVLTPEQRAQLVTLAEGQVDSINTYGYQRFVLMDAFRRLLEETCLPGPVV